MTIEQYNNITMISFPNCKINIGLNVVEKRKDGFHNIETVFYPVSWCDALEIIPSKKLAFSSSGIKIPNDKKGNLCLRAYHLLAKDFKIPKVKIHLHKNIPIGAGLGGGSSDAAFTLKMLNEMFELKLKEKQLLNYASRLGSDCAFFILNRPVFAKGKGDELEEISLDLTKYKIVIVYPKINISTAEAYSGIIPKKSKTSLNEIIENKPIHQWKNFVCNDFEENIFKKSSRIARIKKQLEQAGAVYASMSGSGSGVYGIFEKLKERKSITKVFPSLELHLEK